MIRFNMACMLFCVCEYLGSELFHNSQYLIHSNKCYYTYRFPICCLYRDTVCIPLTKSSSSPCRWLMQFCISRHWSSSEDSKAETIMTGLFIPSLRSFGGYVVMEEFLCNVHSCIFFSLCISSGLGNGTSSYSMSHKILSPGSELWQWRVYCRFLW